jgi:hypothetical protein
VALAASCRIGDMMDNNRQGARGTEAYAGSRKNLASLPGFVNFGQPWPLLEEFAVEGEHMPGRADIRVLEDAGLISEAQFSGAIMWRITGRGRKWLEETARHPQGR